MEPPKAADRWGSSRLAVAAAICLTVALGATGAAAQDASDADPTERAAALADEGATLYEAGDREGALDRFEQALEYVRDPAFAFNIAYINDELERFYQASRYYRLYLDLYPGAPNREDVQTRLTELDELLRRDYAELDVTTTPSGAQVLVSMGDRTEDYGTTPLQAFVPPGPVTVEARLEGYLPAVRQRTAVAGVRLEIEMGELVAQITEPVEPPSRWPQILGISAVGVGAAAFITGITLWVLAQNDADTYEEERGRIGTDQGTELTRSDFNDLATSIDNKATVGNVLFGVGLGLVIGGVAVLLFVHPETDADESVASIPDVLMVPGGFGLGWSGRF